MRYPEKNLVIVIITSVALFIAAVMCYTWLFDMLVPPVDGAIYDVTIFTSPFRQALFFALICAAVPPVCFILWQRIPIAGISKRISSVILVVGSITGAALIRRQFFRSELISVTREAEPLKLNARVPVVFDNLNMEYWMFVGLIMGAALTFLFFRKKTKNGQFKKTYKKIPR